MLKISKFLFYFIVFLLFASIVSSLILIYQTMERSRVVRVVDGDSFETKDGRRIRLLGIDAPERNRCLYNEASGRLKELILDKRVSLTDTVTDDYGRILANVLVVNDFYYSQQKAGPAARGSQTPLQNGSTSWISRPVKLFLGIPPSRHPLLTHLHSFFSSKQLFVNKILVEEGLARFSYTSSPHYEELKEAANKAKSDKKGIYSQLCRSSNPANDCIIKGNVNSAGKKFYHLPHCLHYNEVIIDTASEDQWFCSEEEAIKAGFRKAAGC